MAEVLGNEIPERLQEQTTPKSEFGKREKIKWDFETLQADVRDPKKNIKSSVDYTNNGPKYNWPAAKTLTTMPDFPKHLDGSNDWDTFLGNEKWTFETLQADVRDKKIKSSEDYGNNAPKYNWPSRHTLVAIPNFPKRLDGSNDWNTFLGRK